MNRRNIVHSVAAERPVGALSPNGEGASPPAPATLAFRAGVISINAGAKALECLISNPHLSSTRIVALDAQPLSFVNTVDLVHISIGAERVFSGDEPAVRKITHEQMKALIAAISEVDVVFVVVQPGERCELNNAIAIASTLQEKGIPGFGIALLPFAFSKMPTLRNATEELHTLSEYLTTFPVSRDDLLRRRIKDPDSDTVTNMSAQIAEQASDVSRVDVPAAIERIIYSVIAPEICETRVSYDLSEVITYLDGCRIAFVGYGSSGDSQGLGSAVTAAINHPLLGPEFLKESSALLGIIESRTSGERMLIVREAMTDVRELVGDRCNVLFSWIGDRDLPSDYRVTLMASHFDSKIAKSRQAAGEIVSIRGVGTQPSVNVSAADLDAATNLIQNAFQPGMAINGPVSFVQRQMRIGHQRASAIVEALECAGVIAPTAGGSGSFSHRRVS